MIEEDKILLQVYMWGFNDELTGLPEVIHYDNLDQRAYNLGRLDAQVGDDMTSLDYQSNEDILKKIKG